MTSYRKVCYALVAFLLSGTALANDLSPQPNNILTEQELVANVALFSEIVSQKVELGDIDSIRVLLPLYAATPNHEVLLLLFAKGLVAEADGDITLAIDQYEQALALDPNLTGVRLHLWQAYQQQARYLDAKKTKQLLLSNEQLPAHLATALASTKPNPITKSLGLNYIKDDNVNNAPKQPNQGQWQFAAAEKATGIGYHGDVGKVFTPANHIRIHPSVGIAGKYFWDNKEHNDTTINTAVTTSYQNSQARLSLAPYYQRRHFSGTPYSTTLGLTLALNTVTKDAWHTGVQVDYASTHHDTRPFLDGRRLTLGANVGRSVNANHWQVGTSLSTQDAKDKSEAYQDRTLFVSLVKDWGNLQSTHRLGLGQKRYEAADFFNILRKDTRYNTSHSLWHKKLSYHGFSPSIHWQWERIDSNHFAYDGDSQRLFFEINKRF